MRMVRGEGGWVWFTAVGLLAVPGYVMLDQGDLASVYYDALELVCVIAMVFGVHRHHPDAIGSWWLLIAGQFANLVGDCVYDVWHIVLHDDTSPGLYDIPYLLSYLGFAGGLLGLLRRRGRGRGYDALLDSMIIASAFALLTWTSLLKPLTLEPSSGLAGSLVTIAYPTLDLMLLTMVVCLLISDGSRKIAFLLLVATMVSFLASDYLWAFVGKASGFDPGTFLSRLMGTGFLIAAVLLAAATLHPSMAQMGAPTPEPVIKPMSRWRLLCLTCAIVMAPVMLAWQARNAEGVSDGYAIALSSVTMFLLVVTRMTMLNRQVYDQSRILQQQGERLRELAEEDGLTGLANRRAWDIQLPAAMARADRNGGSLTVAMIDIDHFKKFNDTYGHQGGDRLLKEAAAAWKNGLRSVDLLARYGGEEFAVLMTDVGGPDAVDVLNRLRGTTPMGWTFSAGVATWDGRETGEELVQRADQALYRAKEAGRDRVERDPCTAKTLLDSDREGNVF